MSFELPFHVASDEQEEFILRVPLKSQTFNTILKGKRNAYFDFQNVGFIIWTNFVSIPAIYTHWYRQLNFSTNFLNFCWWRIPLAISSLPLIVVHRLYVKETRARKQITFDENGLLNNFPPSDCQFVNQ